MVDAQAHPARGEIAPLGLLTAAWWAAVAVANPTGDFPLNDDWGYAPAVRALVEEGALRFTDWQSMPLLSHVLWGSLFCWPAGFSHEALRLSTLVAGWLGVLATYWLLREARAPRAVAAVGAAAVLVNPIYFQLACTFMTDVPFVVALAATAAAWLRAERTQRARWYVLATLLATWATLGRQLGIAVPLAWTIVAALRHGLGRRWVLTALLPALTVIGALVGYERVVDATIGLPALYAIKTDQLRQALGDLVRLHGFRNPLIRSAWGLTYSGLFAIPLSGLVWDSLRPTASTRWLPWAGGVAGAAAFAAGIGFPLTGNIWIDLGVGPRTIPGAVPGLSDAPWALVTVVAGVGAGLLAVALAQGARHAGIVLGSTPSEWPRRVWSGLRMQSEGSDPDTTRRATAWLFALATASIAFVPVSLVYGPFFDRYLLTQLPFVLLLVWLGAGPQARFSRATLWAAVVVLALGLGLSSLATRDYFGWQRARWEAVARLDARGVPRDAIRAGFEVDNHDAPEQGVIRVRVKTRWAVSASMLAGHRVIDRVPVDAILPGAIREILLLERVTPTKPARGAASDVRPRADPP